MERFLDMTFAAVLAICTLALVAVVGKITFMFLFGAC